MKRLNRIVNALLTLILVITPLLAAMQISPVEAATNAQNDPKAKAQELLDSLTPEQRVGQLFLVTFNGPEAGAHNTPIYDLIVNHFVGGAILSQANDNIKGYDQTLPTLLSLTRQIQMDALTSASQPITDTTTGKLFRPAYIPLFIGISQEGDGYPYDQILSGMTQLPSQMAIGATWDPAEAEKAGRVLGSELSELGINMLLGPSLDVLETPHSEGTGDLGVRTFGGDPFWVGEMGKAFITGVHTGSGGEVAVITKHFPGYGSSDRLPEDEVATVLRSLAQLQLIDMSPFFSVTGNNTSPDAITDGLLISHIRFQGLQGDIRTTTRPISFDPDALSKLMSLDPLPAWRSNGGVLVSDDLGSQAVHRFYDSSGQTYDAPKVALSAFLAGNDLLYMGNVQSGGDADSYTSLLRTLSFFTRKYREDAAFQKLVNDAVLRILTVKYRLYKDTFTRYQVLPPSEVSGTIGQSSQVTFEIEQESATLVSPSPAELNNRIPTAPGRDDHIVFITDTRNYKQCSNCKVQNVIDKEALQQAAMRLYNGQILPQNLVSYSFDDLQAMLDSGTGQLQIENDLRQARWIIFNMINVDPNIPSSRALIRFLSERPDLFQKKILILFAFNAPYYLDATDISKLTAYYALYSKTPRAIEVAARLLFQEAQATGASPVSVAGIGYYINEVTYADPTQTIQLYLDYPTNPSSDTSSTPTPEPTPQFKSTDSIPVRTGVILDHNGHPVPDGTTVDFTLVHEEGNSPQPPPKEAKTNGGIARTVLPIGGNGKITISAESDEAQKSATLVFYIPPDNNPVPTDVPPTFTPSPTSTPEPTPTPTQTQVATIGPPPPRTKTNINEWFFALLATAAVSLGIYLFSNSIGQIRWGVRSSLLSLIGGMLAYSYLAMGMPGATKLVALTGSWGVLAVTLLGCALGIGAALGWRRRSMTVANMQ